MEICWILLYGRKLCAFLVCSSDEKFQPLDEGDKYMIYSHEVEQMCPVAQGVNHGQVRIPEEAKWVKAKEIKIISGPIRGVG